MNIDSVKPHHVPAVKLQKLCMHNFSPYISIKFAFCGSDYNMIPYNINHFVNHFVCTLITNQVGEIKIYCMVALEFNNQALLSCTRLCLQTQVVTYYKLLTTM